LFAPAPAPTVTLTEPPGDNGKAGTSIRPPAPPPAPPSVPPPPVPLFLVPPAAPPATTNTLALLTPVGTENEVVPVDVKLVTTGALTVILNALSAVALALVVVALTVKLLVVSDPTALAVPVIAPDDVLKLSPDGTPPETIE
jgi:hypothetical protein